MSFLGANQKVLCFNKLGKLFRFVKKGLNKWLHNLVWVIDPGNRCKSLLEENAWWVGATS